MSTLQDNQKTNEDICARCGFTTTNGEKTPDEGIICPRCYVHYEDDKADYPSNDGWLY